MISRHYLKRRKKKKRRKRKKILRFKEESRKRIEIDGIAQARFRVQLYLACKLSQEEKRERKKEVSDDKTVASIRSFSSPEQQTLFNEKRKSSVRLVCKSLKQFRPPFSSLIRFLSSQS